MTQKDNDYSMALFAAYVNVAKRIGEEIYKKSQDKKKLNTECSMVNINSKLKFIDDTIKHKVKLKNYPELMELLDKEFADSFSSMMHIYAALPKDKRDIGEQLLEALQMGKLELENDSLTIKD